jgi:hypothetical protein
MEVRRKGLFSAVVRRFRFANKGLSGGAEISLIFRPIIASKILMDEAGTALPADDEQIPGGRAIETHYLKQLKVTHRARAHAAMRWRPRFLKALAMSCSITSALRAARVAYNTMRAHERSDPEFATQLKEAQEEGAQLLHDVAFRDALEGVCEPVFWQGIQCGHIRKFDNRLRVEMLRAHMPRQFKTPGRGDVKVNVGAGAGATLNQTNIVVDAQGFADLVALRQEALAEIQAGREAKMLTSGEVTEVPKESPVSPQSQDPGA